MAAVRSTVAPCATGFGASALYAGKPVDASTRARTGAAVATLTATRPPPSVSGTTRANLPRVLHKIQPTTAVAEEPAMT